MKRIFYFLSFLLLLTSCSGKKDNKTISIGYINWDDGIALTHLVEVILAILIWRWIFWICYSKLEYLAYPIYYIFMESNW